MGDGDLSRGFELAGRERFFRARALFALDKQEEALSELSALLKGAPLSYYMLQAYSWLEQKRPGSAASAVSEAEAQADSEPFQMAGGPELTRPGFARMMDLLRIGELDAAVRELDALGLRGDSMGSDILWGVALLYERAGFSKFSAALTRKRLGEVSRRWPVGQWAKAWELAFPRPYWDVVKREAAELAVTSSDAHRARTLPGATMRCADRARDPDRACRARRCGCVATPGGRRDLSARRGECKCAARGVTR